MGPAELLVLTFPRATITTEAARALTRLGSGAPTSG